MCHADNEKVATEGIELLNQEMYNYLEILEADTIKQEEMKEK